MSKPADTNFRTPSDLEVAKYKEDVVHINLSRLKECDRWLFGKGTAIYNSEFISMHYNETRKGWTETDPYLHYHRDAEEYYVSFEGCLTVQVGNNLIRVEPCQLLKVSRGVPHGVASVETPYRGFTIRVPLSLEDKAVLKDKKLRKPKAR